MMMLVHAATPQTLEDALVRAAAQGDRAAFGELYSRYARMVHGILLARVPPADAEDLVQDVFLSAMNQIGTLRAAAAFPGWLAAIARHRAMDHFRAVRNFAPLDDHVARTRGTNGANTGTFEVLELIRSLPEAYRETLILRLVEGMTGPEIAARTGLTAESVRVNLCRGIKMLRRLL